MIWLLVIALALGVALLAARPLWRAEPETAAPRAAHDVAHYKAQLQEIERDLARGVIDEEHAEAARREVSRQLLAAADLQNQSDEIAAAPRAVARGAAIGVCAALTLGAIGLYTALGAPHLSDAPLAARDFAEERRNLLPDQAEAERRAELDRARRADAGPPPEIPENVQAAIQRLEERVAGAPVDVSAHLMLAETYLRIGRETEAWPLYQQAIDNLGEATEPQIHARLAEAMIFAAGGVVSKEAEAALQRATDSPRGRFFRGLADAQRGETERAIAAWATLYRDHPDAPFAAALLEQIRQAAPLIGEDPNELVGRIRTATPRFQAERGGASDAPEAEDSLGGPDAEDIAAAAEMSAEDRQAMIRGMVDGLAAKLENEPGNLPGWLHLIRSYAALDEREKAEAAYAHATKTFAENAQALGRLAAAARSAGLEP